MKTLRVAIVYDWIDSWGGVERLLLELYRIYPEATLYTSYYDPGNALWAHNMTIQTSFIEKLPSFIKKSRMVSLPLYPYAFESFNLSEYDLVISVTSAFAKAVISRPGTLHICYLLTPPRFLWSHTDYYIRSPLSRLIAAPLLNKLRQFDGLAAQRPDYIFSLSHAVADRCRKFYHRESEVLYPPFDTAYWQTISDAIKKDRIVSENPIQGSYFLLVSRLEPYKNIEVALDAFARTPDQKLFIVGKGRQGENLRRNAPRNVSWIENISDTELGILYAGAQGLIMPQEEDFGYVSLEAQFFGCPVISLRRGGALETVQEGQSGIFFDEPTGESLVSSLEKYHTISYNIKSHLQEKGLSHSQQFSKENFRKKFTERVGSLITNY